MGTSILIEYLHSFFLANTEWEYDNIQIQSKHIYVHHKNVCDEHAEWE